MARARVHGPYTHATGFRLRLVDASGAERDVYYQTKDEAHAAKLAEKQRLGCADTAGTARPIKHRKPDGSLKWSQELIDKILQRIAKDPNDDQLLAVGRTVSQLVGARAKTTDTSEIEDRLSRLEHAQEREDTAAKHGTGSEGPRRSTREKPAPGQSVR